MSMQQTEQVSGHSGGLSYKWTLAIVLIFGMFMSVLDTTIVNVAIPRLQSAFGASLSDVQWVATAYTLTQGVVTPLTPFLAEYLGIKRFYIAALFVFIIGSALCGIAWSLPILITFRILQAAGGAVLMPLSISLLAMAFPPEERGTAIGTLGIPILLAPALGPTVGGYLVTYYNWQLIFYINLPIGIVGILLAFIFMHATPPTRRHLQFDIPGFIFAAIGLASLLYALSSAGTDGWSSTTVISYLIIGIVGLLIFIPVELATIRAGRQPLMDLRIFANGPFSTSNIALTLITIALFGGLFLIPVYLQELRGLSAYQAGLILLPQALGSMVATVVGGRLVDRIGVKPVIFTGIIILAYALWHFSDMTLDLPYGQFQILLILRGLGLGLCSQPLMVSSLWTVPMEKTNQATSIISVIRFIASSLGVAILSTTVQTQTHVHYARLAEQVTPNSTMGQFFVTLQHYMMSKGMDANSALHAAALYMYQKLELQGYMLAMDDAFRLTLILTAIAFVAIFFVRGGRKLGDKDVKQQDINEEAATPTVPQSQVPAIAD